MDSRRDGAVFRMVLAIAGGLVVVRAMAFLVFEELHFNADQAVYGIMALHLGKGLAFPLYTYGQGYILAVSVWPAAPLVALLGPTVLALKLPLLFYNLAIVALLVVGLTRDSRLPAAWAGVATIPFTLAPAGPASKLVEHAGGNVEPFLWILLLWALRNRPVLLGLVGGVGFCNREFTAFGFVALAVVAVLEGRHRERDWWRRAALAAAVFAVVLFAISALRPYSTHPSTWTPGVGYAGWGPASARLDNLGRFLPALAGAALPARVFKINVPILLGHAWAPALLLLACGAAVVGTLTGGRVTDRPRLSYPIFLLLVGLAPLAAYVLFGRGSGTYAYLRYVLLALLLPVGLFGLAFARGLRRPQQVAASFLLAWGLLSLGGHARLLRECLRSPPPSQYRELISFLVGRGFETGFADYPTAYPLDYLSGERVRIRGQGRRRVPAYRAELSAHRDRAVAIVRSARCTGGTRVGRWCVVGPPAPRRLREAAEQARTAR